MNKLLTARLQVLACLFLLMLAAPAKASFHLWDITEIYSNADGTVQFIELATTASGQQFLSGHNITSSNGTTNTYNFTTNLPGDSTGKTFLIGTTGFAALGIVTPDYVVPNGFLYAPGGTIVFAGVDTFTYTTLPTSGTLSLYRNGTTGVNTPKNFAGQTGTINPLSTFEFQYANYFVNETEGTVTINVLRSGDTSGSQSVTYNTVNGTAVAPGDYTAKLAQVLTFAAGETSKPISITIINDALIEPDENFTVTLSAPTAGAGLGTTKVATVTISSEDKGVKPAAASVSVAEGAGAATVTLKRLGSGAGTLSVNYSTTNGTAMAGSHYAAASGTITWNDAEVDDRLITVNLIDNAVTNANRMFNINLSGVAGGSLLNASNVVVTSLAIPVTIVDDDNVVQFSMPTTSVSEVVAGGKVNLNITRTGSIAFPASVTWTSADGTASSGTNFGVLGVYTPVTGTVNWNAGEGTTKIVQIPILNTGAISGNRVFTVNLSDPNGSAVGTNATVTVTITEGQTGLAFEQATYSIAEGTGTTVTLKVLRTGSTAAATSISYATSNGTALAGTHYTAKSGVLSWAANDGTPKSIVITIAGNNAINDGDRQFNVMLSSPTNGALPLEPQLAVVTIIDDDVPAESEVYFSAPKFSVQEGVGANAQLTVSRTIVAGGSLARAVSVKYSTTAGTAMATSDFTPRLNQVLSWNAGDGTDKVISIPITNDAIAEGPETFKVTLSAPSPGLALGAQKETTVTILDDDEKFPAGGQLPAGWVSPAAADPYVGTWHVANDPGAAEGFYSLRSESILDGESASISTTGNYLAGNITFKVRISSEKDFDVLTFSIDDVVKQTWSGTANTAWQTATFPVTAGTHTFRWTYTKDGSISAGQDAAWLDAVVLPTPDT